MAVLETIRTKIGWLIIALIAFSLLSFIVDFNSLSSAFNATSSKYSVGKIDGKKVSYKEFQEQVEYQTSIAEMVNGTVSSDEEHQQIRNAAWQHFVDQNLFLKKAAAAGIEVGKGELADLLGQQEDFVNLVQSMESDQTGNLRTYLDYVQNSAYTQQFYAKYGSLFAASAICNDLSVKNEMDANNTTSNAKVLTVVYPFQDSTITVSSSEIKNYYKAHKEQFKQVANRDIEYALIEVIPSDDDLAAANKAVMDVYEEFQNTTNMKAFLMRNSEMSLSNYYYKDGELNTVNREINDFVFGNNSGVSPVINNGNEFYAAQVVDVKNMPDSVYVRHILIQGDNALADSLFNVVKAGKTPFAEVAALYSADQNNTVAAPGDLGWMTQTYMIQGFESVMTAELNKPFVLDTQYGRHIVEVTAKTKPIQKKQVAILQKTAVPSKATMNEAYSKANTLATAAAGSYDKLVAAAKEQNIYLRAVNVNEATSRYSAVDKSKEVTRWVFEAKKGQASNVITVNQNYLFVVGVKDTHKEGYATVQEVASTIQSTLFQEKLADKTLAEVKAKVAGLKTIEEMAEALGETVMQRDNISFATVATVEPALAGAVAGTENGKVSVPVKGIMGVYIVEVTDRTTGAFYTENDAKALAEQKAQYTTQMIIPAMMQSTNTVDNRERFF